MKHALPAMSSRPIPTSLGTMARSIRHGWRQATISTARITVWTSRITTSGPNAPAPES